MSIMPDDVWPISAENPGPKSLTSYNGFGFGLKGFTRPDAAGYRFATHWFMLLGLPIAPLGRYYLREVDMRPGPGTAGLVTRYHIAGSSLLRPIEVVRTYAFCWLTPVAVVAPLLALLARADDYPWWLSIGAVAIWPIVAIVAIATALTFYRDRWAPRREARWCAPADREPE